MVAVQERCKPCRNLKEFWSVNLNYWNSGKGKPACNQLFVMCGVCSLENRQLLCQTASSWAHYVMSSSRQALLKERQSQKVWVISESSRSKPGSLRPECWNSIWTWRENCIDAKTRCECDHNLLRKASASTSIVTAHIHFWPIARSGRLSPSPLGACQAELRWNTRRARHWGSLASENEINHGNRQLCSLEASM